MAVTFAERPKTLSERYRVNAGTLSLPVASVIGTVPSNSSSPSLKT